MRNKIFAFVLLLTILFALIPADTQAATVPAKVTKALNKAVDENGRAIIIDQSASRIYLFKRDCKTGEWKLKKSFRCIVGKRMCKNKHYFLHRSKDIDMIAFGIDYDRWSYGMYIDCYEKAYTNMIHSYVDHYNGKTWKTKKTTQWNTNGISICEKNARWIWDHCGDGTAIQVV